MKKLLILVIALVCIYAGLGVVAGYVLPMKIEEAERKQAGIGVAISQVANDQLLASSRMREITSQTLGSGKTKVDEIAMMLGDPDLNRLALTYLGADWSVQRSGLLGSVQHSRCMLKEQKDARNSGKSRLNEKIKELEAKKKSLSYRIKSPSDRLHFQVEMDDIERQLVTFRSSNTYKEYMEKDQYDKVDIEAKAKNENALFKLASDYQAATIGALNRVMAERLAALRFEEAEPSRLRWKMSFFNIWPLNLICKMPVEK